METRSPWAVIEKIEGSAGAWQELSQTGELGESPGKIIAALAENAVEQTGALCARMSTITLGITAWLAIAWVLLATTSPLSPVVTLVRLMESLGG